MALTVNSHIELARLRQLCPRMLCWGYLQCDKGGMGNICKVPFQGVCPTNEKSPGYAIALRGLTKQGPANVPFG